MQLEARRMTISSGWLQAAIITLLFGFTILGILAYLVITQHPPIPKQFISSTGEVLFTDATVMKGQNLFQKLGLMQYGTIFGQGAYLGPDFTAQYLWHAREPAFFEQPVVRVFEWLRMPGDVIFILGGILPVVYLAVRMFGNRKRGGEVPIDSDVEFFTSGAEA